MVQDRPLELARLEAITTFNTLAIANKMKRVWKDSEEFDPEKYVCNKLIFLYLDAQKFLGNELSPTEIIDAGLAAHSADFDAHMTSIVFEALLHFSNLTQVFVEPVNLRVARILIALQKVEERTGFQVVFLFFLHIFTVCISST